MPTIKDFGAYRIMIYTHDHGIPHFHVNGKRIGAKITIESLSVIQSQGLRPRDIRRVKVWAAENQALLMETWRKYHD